MQNRAIAFLHIPNSSRPLLTCQVLNVFNFEQKVQQNRQFNPKFLGMTDYWTEMRKML